MGKNKKSKSIFWESVKRPFCLCMKNKPKTILWFIYIIIGGLLGVFINLISRWLFGGMSFQEAIYIESINGTFYTYSIVLVSATIGPLFFKLSETKQLHFPEIKAFTITTCVFIMFFCALFYSNCVKNDSVLLNNTNEITYTIDWAQAFFFILAIGAALYTLGLEYLDRDYEKNRDIDSSAAYREEENESVSHLEEADPQITDNGTKL